ncbi:tetratricopeptide repeat protein [bacterium]|nr:tetratricopeptide repeat protein [bacterium]
MKPSLFVPILLVLAVLTAYGQTLGFDFVNFDDPDYVTENPLVARGLSGEGLRWAFTTHHAQNYHPLTWASLMLDAQLFGVKSARGFHLTNLLLHALNALLLFWLLRALTGALWKSALVAGFLALHPLHVESVAWIAERKDVLSQAFALGATLAWLRWARSGRPRDYALALALLALGLLAKQMLVTLPLLWLLLDFWPLGRLCNAATRRQAAGLARRQALLEKLPALALSAGAIALTLAAQTRRAALLPVDDRLANAVVATARYLGKLVWPHPLSALYPHPAMAGGEPLAVWQIGGALVLIAALSAAAFRFRRLGWPFVGWFWFLGALVPVIGIVQVGEQAMADRYAYLPFIGLYLALVWGIGAWLEGPGRRWRDPAAVLAVLALFACLIGTRERANAWRDSIALGERAREVKPVHPKMLYNLGLAYADAHRYPEAAGSFTAALAISPDYAKALNNLGQTYEAMGKLDGARGAYQTAVAKDPDFALARINLSRLLAKAGDMDGAIAQRIRAVALDPDDAAGRNNLGALLAQAGRFEEAVTQFRAALAIDPGNAEARRNLEVALRLIEQRGSIPARPAD